MEFNIKEICQKLNITKDTLYYYEDEGLLPDIKRGKSGYRVYTQEDINWIYLILCLRDIDMPIRLIKDYIKLLKSNGTIEQKKNMILSFKKISDEKLLKCQNTKMLLDKKLEFYSQLAGANAENEDLEKCYDYHEEWDNIKKNEEKK